MVEEKEEGEVEGKRRGEEEEAMMMMLIASRVVLLHLLKWWWEAVVFSRYICNSFDLQGSCPFPVSSGTGGQTNKNKQTKVDMVNKDYHTSSSSFSLSFSCTFSFLPLFSLFPSWSQPSW